MSVDAERAALMRGSAMITVDVMIAAMRQAFRDHDREAHDVTDMDPPSECIEDVSARIVALLATPPSPAPGLPLDAERLATVLRPWLGIRSEKELASSVRSIVAEYARLATDAATPPTIATRTDLAPRAGEADIG